jgi:hypothetical protein
LCFGKGHVVRKAVEESAESEKRGAVFMNIVEKKKRRLWGGEKRKAEWLTMSNSSGGLATTSTEGRVIARCGVVKLFDWLLGAPHPASQEIVTRCRDALRGENVLIWQIEGRWPARTREKEGGGINTSDRWVLS